MTPITAIHATTLSNAISDWHYCLYTLGSYPRWPPTADDNFKRIIFNENIGIFIRISLKFVHWCLIFNKSMLEVMFYVNHRWYRPVYQCNDNVLPEFDCHMGYIKHLRERHVSTGEKATLGFMIILRLSVAMCVPALLLKLSTQPKCIT